MLMKRWAPVLLPLLAGSVCQAQATQPAQIFQRVLARYQSMSTYAAEGIVTTVNMEPSGETILKCTFSIKLKKPDLYLITWTNENTPDMPFTQVGAVWNAGSQPYLYMHVGSAMNAYTKVSDDGVALGGASGISNESALLIPMVFLNVPKHNVNPFSALVNPQIEGSEKIDGDDCYKISGHSTYYQTETFWISKSTYLIRKYRHSLEKSPTAPRMSEQEIDESVKAMGPATDEDKKQMKSALQNALKAKLKSFFTQVQLHITAPQLQPSDFAFKPPAGAVLKESLFGQPSTQKSNL